MTTAALPLQDADALRPRPPGGMGRGAMLALLVHALLVAALAASVSWRSQTPQAFSAELWAAAPQVAAARAVESEPRPAAAPPPAAPQPARVAAPVPAPRPDAQIAIEKARQLQREQVEKDRAERQRAERDKAERERLEREKLEREKTREAKAQADARQREQQVQRDKQAEESRLARQREDNLKRMMGQADATGSAGSTGSAARDAGPSASYAGKLIASIRPRILFTENLKGNPSADVEVRAAPGGSILSRRLVKSSGNKDWDEAVLRAIDRTGELPRDVDGRVPPVLVITFTP
jgi:colicin import membrane protein